jgi:DHA1 family tetracycline resistance protein-like MFS transporter
MTTPSFKKVLPYALVVFFGYVGFAMPLPMLPEMFLDSDVGILPAYYTREFKTLLLGVVMAAYPFGQLIGAPILGKCSDKWGRKKIILLSLLGSMLGYICTAIATSSSSIEGIFGGLFLCGLCEGNVAIAQSVVGDLAAEGSGEHKVSHFGWINLFVCFAFIIGPILGGQLSDSSLIPWFTFATPFWIAAFMTLIGIGIVIRFSEETRKKEEQIAPQGYWKSFKEGMNQKKLRTIYVVNFFLALGYFSYFRFFPVYIENKFSFNVAMLGYAIAYGSVMFAISSALLLKRISGIMTVEKAVGVFSFLLAISFFILLIPSSPWSLLGTIPAVDVCLAVVMTYSAVLVSNASSPSFQGQAFGMLTSVQVAAEVLTGLLGGILAGYQVSFPMVIGSLMLIVASLILLISKTGKTSAC